MELLIGLCLLGIVLGVYCHFLLLVPLTLATVIVFGSMAAWQGQSVFEILVAMFVAAVALQGGYMIGLTSRELLVPSKRI